LIGGLGLELSGLATSLDRVLLNTAKNTREQIYLKVQGFQQQGTMKNTREQIYLEIQDFNNKGAQGTNLLDIN